MIKKFTITFKNNFVKVFYAPSHPKKIYAVDGNTDGKFSNRSTASTEHEQGAWWQVDLGSKKNIKASPLLEMVTGVLAVAST
jgi:hypothetical protein